MKVLLDSSVLVAGLVAAHSMHSRAFPWLRRALAGEFSFYVAAHSIAEVYAVLTRLPVSPRIAPAVAAQLIKENMVAAATVIALSPADYARIVRHAAERGLAGGAVYDAIIAHAAKKVHVDRLVTLNIQDFARVWPNGRKVLAVP